MLKSYSSPFALGHKATEGLWDGTVWAQEKIDGSQFSFGRRGDQLHCRSRNTDLDSPVGMFKLAVETVARLGTELVDGYTYRGEFLAKPKHNTLAYDRAPAGHVILFDVDCGDQDYMLPPRARREAHRLGLEFAPICGVYRAKQSLDDLRKLLNATSILGKQAVEGVVLKNYEQFDRNQKKVLMAKLVSADFQEAHASDWKQRNPSKSDIILLLIERYGTEARWRKAVQHLAEAGRLEHAPRDIGMLIKEVPEDILAEHEDEIKRALFGAFVKDLRRGWTRGLPEWYKRELAEQALA